jgi:hypothetical protein
MGGCRSSFAARTTNVVLCFMCRETIIVIEVAMDRATSIPSTRSRSSLHGNAFECSRPCDPMT